MSVIVNLLVCRDLSQAGTSGPALPAEKVPDGSAEVSFDALLAMAQTAVFWPPVEVQSTAVSSAVWVPPGEVSDPQAAAGISLTIAGGSNLPAHPPGNRESGQLSGLALPDLQAIQLPLPVTDPAAPVKAAQPATKAETAPSDGNVEPGNRQPVSATTDQGRYNVIRVFEGVHLSGPDRLAEAGSEGGVEAVKGGEDIKVGNNLSGAGSELTREDDSAKRDSLFSNHLAQAAGTEFGREVFRLNGAEPSLAGRANDPFRVIAQLTKGFEDQSPLPTNGGVREIEIRLHPEHLGRVHLKLSLEEGVLSARITVGSSAAREAVDQGLAQLRQTLGQQGYNVGSLDVNFGGASLFGREQRQEKPNGQRQGWNRGYESVAPMPLSAADQITGAGTARLLDYIA